MLDYLFSEFESMNSDVNKIGIIQNSDPFSLDFMSIIQKENESIQNLFEETTPRKKFFNEDLSYKLKS